MNAFDEFATLAAALQAAQGGYCLVGGVALAYHDLPRFTKDIDLLVSPEGLPVVAGILEQAGYFRSTQPWTFASTRLTLHRYMKVEGKEYLLIDLLMAGEPRHLEIITGAIQARHDGVVIPVATKADLVWLKGKRNSPQDQVDIQGLTR